MGKGRKPIYRITVAEVEYTAHRLAEELMRWDEPIPAFNTRFPQVLESCLATPFQTFQRRSLYPGIVKKAAMLFYLMIKNHPFQNGNKRVAVTTLLYFLHRNRRWVTISNDSLYEFARFVAASDPKDRKEVIDMVEITLTTRVIRIK